MTKLSHKIFLIVLVAGLCDRIWHDETLVRRQREILSIQAEWNQAVKQDDALMRLEYGSMWRDQQKCHPLLGSEDRDVFCHGLTCMYLEPSKLPEPNELRSK